MGVVTMGARELHAGRLLLLGGVIASLVVRSEASFVAGSDNVEEEVSENILIKSDVLRDISELRREVEQLRSEVRHKDEQAVHDNTEVIVDWLKETVGDLREEVRNLEVQEQGRKKEASEEEIERVRRELGNMKEDILKLRVKEEKTINNIDEMEQKLDHVAKGEEKVLNRINKINTFGKAHEHGKKHSLKKHSKYRQFKHKNLSKKHLQMWMRDSDSAHQELLNILEDNKRQLRSLQKMKDEKETQNCTPIKKKLNGLEKTITQQRDVEEGRHEEVKILFESMTTKIANIEENLAKYEHKQVLLSRKIEKLSNDLNSALRNRSLN